MTTTSVKISELTGPALRYAVNVATGWQYLGPVGVTTESEYEPGIPLCKDGHNDWWLSPEGDNVCAPCHGLPEPDRDWSQCGPLIERWHIELTHVMCFPEDYWTADIGFRGGRGKTPLIAACRAIAASYWGEYADIPSELVEAS